MKHAAIHALKKHLILGCLILLTACQSAAATPATSLFPTPTLPASQTPVPVTNTPQPTPTLEFTPTPAPHIAKDLIMTQDNLTQRPTAEMTWEIN